MQRPVRSPYKFVFITALAVILLSCSERVKIGDLTSNPSRYADKEVTIAGSVGSSFNLLGPGAFEMDDGTERSGY